MLAAEYATTATYIPMCPVLNKTLMLGDQPDTVQFSNICLQSLDKTTVSRHFTKSCDVVMSSGTASVSC